VPDITKYQDHHWAAWCLLHLDDDEDDLVGEDGDRLAPTCPPPDRTPPSPELAAVIASQAAREQREGPGGLGMTTGLRSRPFPLQLDAPVLKLLVGVESFHDLQRPGLDLAGIHRVTIAAVSARSVPTPRGAARAD
jgi:hypothetical protein